METFEEWWMREGRFLDPDTDDVPWFDKRKELAGLAFTAAKAQSGNYTADVEIMPKQITFGNGRTVRLIESHDGARPNFLEVGTVADISGIVDALMKMKRPPQEESFVEMISRLEIMAEEDSDYDLSENDRIALRTLLENYSLCIGASLRREL